MPKTYNQIYIEARQQLREAGVQGYSLEARLLLANASGKSREELLRDMQLYASSGVESLMGEHMSRRLAGEPVAYITGGWEFYGLELEVDPRVLVPRYDTEVLVDTALEAMNGRGAVRFLDLCTGSGCVGCAIASKLTDSRGVLLDISREALELAARNVRSCGLDNRLVILDGDVREAPPDMLGSFDLIVANPPYISRTELGTLDSSVVDFEPRLALDGGEDGLDYYRVILGGWIPVLRTGGSIAFEIGETQAEDVTMLMLKAGLRNVRTVKDSAGRDRVVCGKK